ILNLILILFEYYFVSHCMLESSVFIFLISTCMIIHMIYISMKWIAFESDIENEIKEYILEEIKNKIQSENFENSKE
ncbi:MAG: hypothetical protein K9M80_02105, partial [Candidatus Marinimicrobia bacterium]|nr:hypothetical protein [Candidatus Neomarinimicrobiota bacterium]